MKLISFQKCLFLLSDQQGTSEWLAQISTSRLAYACFPLMNPTQDVKNWEAKYKNVWLNENKHIQICFAFYERYEHLWKIIQNQTICIYLGYFHVGNKKKKKIIISGRIKTKSSSGLLNKYLHCHLGHFFQL